MHKISNGLFQVALVSASRDTFDIHGIGGDLSGVINSKEPIATWGKACRPWSTKMQLSGFPVPVALRITNLPGQLSNTDWMPRLNSTLDTCLSRKRSPSICPSAIHSHMSPLEIVLRTCYARGMRVPLMHRPRCTYSYEIVLNMSNARSLGSRAMELVVL